MSWTPKERPIYDPAFWRERLREAEERGALHTAVFNTDRDTWAAIEEKHRSILDHYIESADSVLDVGCGYGRLIDLMPKSWQGHYFGMDVSPDFVALARKHHPSKLFVVQDLRDLTDRFHSGPHDWGVCISVKRLIVGHSGQEEWDKISSNLHRLCRRLLILDYDLGEGEVE